MADLDKDNLSALTDADLFKACKRYGMNPGPITATTRSIYEKRLRKVLETATTNGAPPPAAAVTAAKTTTTSKAASTRQSTAAAAAAAAAATATATFDTSVLDKTQQEQQREAEAMAQIKLEQTRLARVGAERDLMAQQELERRREQERQVVLARERERERELAEQIERERAERVERERAKVAAEREREMQRERELREREREQMRQQVEAIERQKRAEAAAERERVERERERERAERERERVERLEQQRRMEAAAARARQQSTQQQQQQQQSAIPVRVSSLEQQQQHQHPTLLNKENLLYPNLNNLERPAAATAAAAAAAAAAATRSYPFKQPFSDATSGYGLQSNVAARRAVDPKGAKSGEMDSELIYPQANSTMMMKDGLGRLGPRGIDVATILGEPKGRSSICPPAPSVATIATATGGTTLSSLPNSNAAASSTISPIRDKWADRLTQHGIVRDPNNTLYTSTLSSPSGIRGRQPIHSVVDKPQLTTAGSVSSTSDLYNQKPDFGMKHMPKSSASSSYNSMGFLSNINFTYAISFLIMTILVYLFFMQIQPNPPNPVDL